MRARRRLSWVASLLLASAIGCGFFTRTEDPAFRPSPAGELTARPDDDSLRVWWIGHATVLVKMGDRWILTDPVFSARLAFFVKRYVAPGIDLHGLPRIDWVLVSHAHADHLDPPSLRRLNPSANLVVPPGALPYLPADAPFAGFAALAPWQSVTQDGVTITAVPARHADGRWQLDGLWSRQAHTGYVIQHRGLTVYFAGDTAWDATIFKEIGRRFPGIDLALIPVGPATRPAVTRWFTDRVHVSPAEAMRVFEDVGARWMLPIHHGTFFRHGPGERRLIADAIEGSGRRDRVLMLQIGQAATVRAAPAPAPATLAAPAR